MKTIDEIQHELRELARELGKIQEAQSAAEIQARSRAQISDDVQPSGGIKPSGEIRIDFEQLASDASDIAIAPHPFEKYDIYTKKCYITFLLSLGKFDPEKLPYTLLLAHRIAFGMNYLDKGYDLRDEYAASGDLSNKQLDELKELLKDNDGRFMLVLDCLLTVGGFDKGRNNALGYIVQVSEKLGIDKDQLVFLSDLAVAILTQELGGFADTFVRRLLLQSFSNIRRFISAKDKQSYPREHQLWKELETAFDNYKEQNSAYSTMTKTAIKRITNQDTDYSENVPREFVLSENVVLYHLFYRALIEYGFSPWDIVSDDVNCLNDQVVQNLKQYLAISKTCPGIFSRIDMHDRFKPYIDAYEVGENAKKIISEKKDPSQNTSWTVSVFVTSEDISENNNSAEIFDLFTPSGNNPLKPGQPIPNCITLLVLYIQLNKANNPIGKWNIFKCYLDDLTAPYLNKKGR